MMQMSLLITSHGLWSPAVSLIPVSRILKVQVLEASQGMELIGSLAQLSKRRGADEKTLYDPMACWSLPRRLRRKAGLSLIGFVGADSDHRKLIRPMPANFKKRPKTDRTLSEILMGCAQQESLNPAYCLFLYLGQRWADPKVLLVASPSREPSPRQLTEIEDFCKVIKTIFVKFSGSKPCCDWYKSELNLLGRPSQPILLENLENLAVLVAKDLKG